MLTKWQKIYLPIDSQYDDDQYVDDHYPTREEQLQNERKKRSNKAIENYREILEEQKIEKIVCKEDQVFIRNLHRYIPDYLKASYLNWFNGQSRKTEQGIKHSREFASVKIFSG